MGGCWIVPVLTRVDEQISRNVTDVSGGGCHVSVWGAGFVYVRAQTAFSALAPTRLPGEVRYQAPTYCVSGYVSMAVRWSA